MQCEVLIQTHSVLYLFPFLPREVEILVCAEGDIDEACVEVLEELEDRDGHGFRPASLIDAVFISMGELRLAQLPHDDEVILVGDDNPPDASGRQSQRFLHVDSDFAAEHILRADEHELVELPLRLLDKEIVGDDVVAEKGNEDTGHEKGTFECYVDVVNLLFTTSTGICLSENQRIELVT